MTLPPPPLDSAQGSPPWARWLQQLWSVVSRVRLREGGPTLTQGKGAPTAEEPSGSLYLRTDGAAATTLYVRAGGAWVAK